MRREEEYTPSLFERLIELKSELLAYTSMNDDPTFQASEEYHKRIDKLENEIHALEGMLSSDQKEELDEEFARKKFRHFAQYIKKFKSWYRR